MEELLKQHRVLHKTLKEWRGLIEKFLMVKVF